MFSQKTIDRNKQSDGKNKNQNDRQEKAFMNEDKITKKIFPSLKFNIKKSIMKRKRKYIGQNFERINCLGKIIDISKKKKKFPLR